MLHSGNNRNLLSHFFGKNFVKATFLLIKEVIDVIFFGEYIFHLYHIHFYMHKFRQNVVKRSRL